MPLLYVGHEVEGVRELAYVKFTESGSDTMVARFEVGAVK